MLRDVVEAWLDVLLCDSRALQVEQRSPALLVANSKLAEVYAGRVNLRTGEVSVKCLSRGEWRARPEILVYGLSGGGVPSSIAETSDAP